MITLRPIVLLLMICTLLMAACSNDSTPEPTQGSTQTPLPFATSAVRERMTLPPSWTPTATPSITPTPTNTLTPTITSTPTITPTRTVAEICEIFSGQFLAFNEAQYNPEDQVDYFFSYDDPNGEIVLKASKRDSDEVFEVTLPSSLVLGTFHVDVLTPGTWDLTYSLNTSSKTEICESNPIVLDIVQPSRLDRLIDTLSTMSAAQKATPEVAATPLIEITAEITAEVTAAATP